MNMKNKSIDYSLQNHCPKDSLITKNVICSKTVQKIAETQRFVGFGGGTEDINIDVTVHKNRIASNIVVIKDKIVNIGVVPVTVIIRSGTGSITFEDIISFQEETECPGVCPEDTVTETPLQVEAVIAQPIRLDGFVGATAFQIIIKVILRTTITATRPVIKSRDGCLIDLNKDLCKTQLPPTIQPPTIPGSAAGFPTVLSAKNAILLTGNESLNSPISGNNKIIKNPTISKNDTN
ncbi:MULTISPECIES: hypothetical protein [Bacillaceae]|uniref:hypothetical protein n=1 Tax=Bacillaceae TaxID=186817 RepID=UPI0011A8EB4E|nr:MULTISPECIES: hypothetical protein [Bacillaceae]MED4476337.1 hypothetical protein [Oceanobacillus caeni]